MTEPERLAAAPNTLMIRDDVGAAAVDGDKNIQFIMSTSAEDRAGDMIDVNGWKLDDYRKNPVWLWAHDRHSLPIAKSLREYVEGGKLLSELEFADYEFAKMTEKLIRGGFLSACSVGFRPIKWAFNEDRGDWACDFEEQELLECSVVPVPCNQEALVAAKDAGIDIKPLAKWAEGMLAKVEPGVWVPKARLSKSVLQRVEQIAAGKKMFLTFDHIKVISEAAPAVVPAPAAAPAKEADPMPVPMHEVHEGHDKEPMHKAGDRVHVEGIGCGTVKEMSTGHHASVEMDHMKGTPMTYSAESLKAHVDPKDEPLPTGPADDLPDNPPFPAATRVRKEGVGIGTVKSSSFGHHAAIEFDHMKGASFLHPQKSATEYLDPEGADDDVDGDDPEEPVASSDDAKAKEEEAAMIARLTAAKP